MRLLGVALIWAVIAGALGLFLVMRDRPVQPATVQEVAVHVAPQQESNATGYATGYAAGYALEITPTFSPAPDPYALADDPVSRSGLVVSLNGHVLYTYDGGGAFPGSIVLQPAPGLGPGVTEYLVEAAPPLGEEGMPQQQAVRMRLLRHGTAVAEQTLWSEPGGVVRGTFRVEPATPEEDAHGG
ncbi:hypothetical protein [Oceanidesulfovibrio marinus]|uniref:Uncharacterized protein n=1 Tax=Oceanidesulfovibrio marinus TaxID=370038 RepID=A0ABX6NDW3_9BACT|nr:hypothetical protein [Oceanidesulfovibrio marinus]QJT08793.1 hypothetical protein E8L03_07580 [Oceanidesulfovibrio marinus]